LISGAVCKRRGFTASDRRLNKFKILILFNHKKFVLSEEKIVNKKEQGEA